MSMELGVALPNGGASPSPDDVLRAIDGAVELGFDSVFASEHVIVSADAPDDYKQSLDGLSCLEWAAARHDGLQLGTSVLILPLHNPFLLARRVAALQLLSGRRLRLGVGVGWNEEEFRFVGVDFSKRGRLADESLRLMRALWTGEPSFQGEFWSYENASFGPLPEEPPEIWVGGGGKRALRRAQELGDAWHPVNPEPEEVARVLEEWPEGRVTARMPVKDVRETGERLVALRDAGLSAVCLRFSEEGAMEAFASEVAPGLRD
jgi:probable F420-dependent oxidoreductase